MNGPTPAGAWQELPRAVRDQVLGTLLQRSRARKAAVAEAADHKADRSKSLPLSFEQAFVLQRQQRHQGRLAWTMGVPPIVLDAVNPAAVERALRLLMQRHEILRTVFPQGAGGYSQRVMDDAELPYTPVRLSLLQAATGAESAVRQRYRALLQMPFDPQRGPLWRAELVYRGERGALLLSFCSLLLDGSAMALLLSQFHALYAQLQHNGEGVPDAEEPAQYADYAARQQRLLAMGHWNAALARAQRRLAGGPPASWQDGRSPLAPTRLYEQLLGPATSKALRAQAAYNRTTPFVVLLRQYLALLARLDGASDLWVAVPTRWPAPASARTLLGPQTQIVLLRHPWEPGSDTLAAVHASTVAELDVDPLPHPLLCEQLERGGPGSAWPLRYFFNLRVADPQIQQPLDVDHAFVHETDQLQAEREEHVLLMVLQGEHSLRLQWYLRTDRFTPAQAEALLRDFHHALNASLAAS